MGWSLPEKICFLLEQRKIRRKDLAAFLGISPQTMTDICTGRSAVTLRHLRGLVRFFGLRADWWLDDAREAPQEWDRLEKLREEDLARLYELGLLGSGWRRLVGKIQAFVAEHRDLWVDAYGPIGPEEARLLGIPPDERGGSRRGTADGVNRENEGT